MANLAQTVHCFEFLSHISYIQISDIDPESRTCGICLAPYQESQLQPGAIDNRPVELACGHVLGLQCLAEWIFSPNFDNRCSLCRVPVVPGFDRSLSQPIPRPLTYPAARLMKVYEIIEHNNKSYFGNMFVYQDIRRINVDHWPSPGHKCDVERIDMLLDVYQQSLGLHVRPLEERPSFIRELWQVFLFLGICDDLLSFNMILVTCLMFASGLLIVFKCIDDAIKVLRMGPVLLDLVLLRPMTVTQAGKYSGTLSETHLGPSPHPSLGELATYVCVEIIGQGCLVGFSGVLVYFLVSFTWRNFEWISDQLPPRQEFRRNIARSLGVLLALTVFLLLWAWFMGLLPSSHMEYVSIRLGWESYGSFP